MEYLLNPVTGEVLTREEWEDLSKGWDSIVLTPDQQLDILIPVVEDEEKTWVLAD